MAVSNSGPDLEEYFINRSEYYSSITPTEKLIADELNEFIQKNLDTYEDKARFINSEANQFERQHTGFFAIAISFIIAGLLNAMPAPTDTDATKFLFASSIVASVIAAALLFLEFVVVRRFHNKWKKKNQDIIDYIAHGNWKNPRQLLGWITKQQKEDHISQHSSSWVVRLEILLVSVSLASLALWVIEKTYNPNLVPWF